MRWFPCNQRIERQERNTTTAGNHHGSLNLLDEGSPKCEMSLGDPYGVTSRGCADGPSTAPGGAVFMSVYEVGYCRYTYKVGNHLSLTSEKVIPFSVLFELL